MDIIKNYFELVKNTIHDSFNKQKDKIEMTAQLFGECMENNGVVQLFGVNHGEEFVNELNYRAGGIAPFHALKFRDLLMRKIVSQEEIDSGEVYQNLSLIEQFNSIYQMDDRDMWCLVSFYGNEPLVEEIARLAKEKNQKVVAVVNKASYCGKLLDYADLWLDMNGGEPDVAMDLDGIKIGQLSSTATNVMAQMITAELYKYFVSQGKQTPVLLSANVKGADIHNNSLTDPYERRVR